MMSAVETHRIGIARPPSDRARRFRLVVIVVGGAYAGYLAATVAGAPGSVVSPLFSVFMLPVPLVVWWAYLRAPPELRRLIHILAWAATLWLLGSLLWYAYYFAGGSEVPEPPGTWDIFLVLARLLVIVAIVDAMRSLISFRIAALDASVICAATLALGAAFIVHGLQGGVSASSLFTLNRPLLGIVTLMLIVSAALGSWQGIPLSIALMALGEVALTIGSLIYSYQAIQNEFVDDRWAGLAWAGGAALSIVAASAIITGIDRPVRLAARSWIPRHPAGSRAVVLAALGGLLLTLGTALYGLIADQPVLVILGVATSVWIGVAMASRARDSIRTAEDAYGRLDKALADSERARDRLAGANEKLTRTNSDLRTTQAAMADLIRLADQRTRGFVRELIEDRGGELGELLEKETKRTQRH